MIKNTETFKEDIHLLLEAGFIAINQADEDSAKKLFDASMLLDDKNVLCYVGKGYVALHKLDTKNAVNMFEKALEIDPENQMARTFLGLTQMFIPNKVTSGEKTCMEAMKETSDPQIKKFAESAIEFSNTFIKKGMGGTESPMKLHKKKKEK
ncbi:MAG: hypothetical protein K940chlam8_00155 [Chlamydiae bacterium]|nr:hypothetical protein [Chlamydiota bacterium]